MTYTRKAVDVEVVQFNGHNVPEIENFIGHKVDYYVYDSGSPFEKQTPMFALTARLPKNQLLHVKPTDYVIKNKDGAVCSCDTQMFMMMYTEKTPNDTWQTRLVQEYVELKEKCDKLKAFVNNTDALMKLTEDNRNLLLEQWEIMKKYLNVLTRRLCINNIEH